MPLHTELSCKRHVTNKHDNKEEQLLLTSQPSACTSARIENRSDFKLFPANRGLGKGMVCGPYFLTDAFLLIYSGITIEVRGFLPLVTDFQVSWRCNLDLFMMFQT